MVALSSEVTSVVFEYWTAGRLPCTPNGVGFSYWALGYELCMGELFGNIWALTEPSPTPTSAVAVDHGGRPPLR
jgi:hypothetical protein